MLQRACPTAKNLVLSGSRQCMHNRVRAELMHDCCFRVVIAVRAEHNQKLQVSSRKWQTHAQQAQQRHLPTQFGSKSGWWQQSCRHAAASLAVVSGAGLVVQCMAADSQTITEKVEHHAIQCVHASTTSVCAVLSSNTVLTVIWLMQATGVTFPLVNKFWQGESYRCMGAGVRTKKVAFVNVKVGIVQCF